MTLRLAAAAATFITLTAATSIHPLINFTLAALTYVITAPAQPTRILLEMDTTTGKMQAQPNDRTTEKYFRERDRS